MRQNTFFGYYFCGGGLKLGRTDLRLIKKSMSASGLVFVLGGMINGRTVHYDTMITQYNKYYMSPRRKENITNSFWFQ